MKSIEQKVIRFISQNNLIDSGDKLLVALSGGPDSVFAISFLRKFQKKFKIELTAVHFNHNLRGRESDKDEKFCEELCENYDIPLYIIQLDVKSYSQKNKISIEEAARKLRYQNLKEICNDFECNKIVTAHNQTDNTETVLLNFISGTGYSGFMGIPIRRDKIIRPVLCLTKEEILEYLTINKISYRIDASNLKNDYKRNFLRNKIIPQLRSKLNPSLDSSIFRSSKILEQSAVSIENFVLKQIKRYIKKESNGIRIKISFFESNDDWLQGEALKLLLRKDFGHDFDNNDFEKIKSIVNKQKGKTVQITSKLIAVRESDFITIGNAAIEDNVFYELKPGEKKRIGNNIYGVIEINKSEIKFDKTRKTEFITADKLDDIFILRKWKSGDKFIPLGMKVFTKVSDFLTNSKLETIEKKNQFILTNRNNIVWIPGLRIDDRFKLTAETTKIYKLFIKEN